MQALIVIEAHGKIAAWSRLARAAGLDARIVATGGHLRSFPDRLFPIGIRLRQDEILDEGRRADPDKLDALLKAVAALPEGAPIHVATDRDVEGDVIALDVLEEILAAFPGRAAALHRVHPGALTPEGVRLAIDTALPLREAAERIVSDAVQGRARAVTDRWIGAVFSKLSGVPVGRVRSALLGAVFLLNRAPHLLVTKPETGEITLQVRSATGGRPFFSRIALSGRGSGKGEKAIMAIAERWRGKLVPGVIRTPVSIGAAVAPRFGEARPWSTGDALIHASRHFRVPAQSAMRGLQDAYIKGMISYPRTESRVLSDVTAARVVRLGFACGLDGLSLDRLRDGPAFGEGPDPGRGAHEGLHPVIQPAGPQAELLKALIRRPFPQDMSDAGRDEIMELMVALVARRSFEAARSITLEKGFWRPDNATPMSAEEMEALENLEWLREDGFSFPWSKDMMTGARDWSVDAMLLEVMIEEGLGRPSTWAAHVGIALASGDIESGPAFSLPRPTPQGAETLKRTPQGVWHPATCRLIEAVLESDDGQAEGEVGLGLRQRARRRVLTWLRAMPDGIRAPLLEALEEDAGTRSRSSSMSSTASPEAASNPFEMDMSLAVPTPYGA
jgi:DNA topoisomerase I